MKEHRNRTHHVPLADVTNAIQYGYTAKSSRTAEGPQYLRITDIQNDCVDWDGVPRINGDSEETDKYRLRCGDIVFARSGATVGKSFLLRETPDNAVFASYLIRVQCDPGILDPEYASYFFKSEDYWQQIYDGSTGTGQPNFNGTKLGQLLLPLRSLDEQRTIVSSIKARLARSGAAKLELRRLPKLVERYKQSVRAAAFQNDDHAPWPISQLEDLIVEGPTNGYSPRAGSNPEGTMSLKLTATTRGVLDLSEGSVKRLDEKIESTSKFWLRPGDLLIQRANSLEYVGVTAMYDGPSATYIYPDLMIRIRAKSQLLARWIAHYSATTEARSYFVENATGTAGNMPKINGKTVKKMPIPVPPSDRLLEAQLLKLERNLKKVRTLHAEAKRTVELLERLERVTLTKAFRGELTNEQETSSAS